MYEALTRGVELKDNKLYYHLLSHYPYFQKILSKRKQAIVKLARLAKIKNAQDDNMQENDKKFTPKYKFEKRFVDKKRDPVAKMIDTTAVSGNEIDYKARYRTYLE